MQLNKRIIVGILSLLVSLLVVACGQSPTNEISKEEPAIVEPIDGEDFNRLTLTERAVERLDIQTAQVTEENVNGSTKLVVPYSAVIYDLQGDTWLYTNPEPRTYIRESIVVDFIDGDKAILQSGPAIGTEIATVAVAELYGIDTGVGK